MRSSHKLNDRRVHVERPTLEMEATRTHAGSIKRADLTRHALSLAWGAIFLGAAAVFFGNLRFGRDVLAVGFQDDFFYYAQVARNLAFHGLSSFDGIHLTNGYHPLWLLILTAVTGVFGRAGVIPFAVALEALQLALVMAISFFALQICRRFCSVAACACILMLQASFAIVLVRSGMEVGLTIATGLGLMWFRVRPRFAWKAGSAFCLGLLASLVVLSRLDAILLMGLLVVLDLLANIWSSRAAASHGLLFLLGLGPVAAYMGLNRLVFGTLMPVSGMAKQMRLHHVPSPAGLRSFVSFLTAAGSPLLGPCVVVILAAMVLLTLGRRKVPRGAGGVVWAALVFPFLHLLTIVTMSDWQLWPWYVYPWLLSGIVAAAIVFGARVGAPSLRQPLQAACFAASLVFLIGYAGLVVARSRPGNNLTYMAGLEIQAFAATHPGVYAMGDRSGAVGYLLGRPLVQLEGLAMDKQYLENIRAQRDLEPVLREYGVRYYIATDSGRDAGGCYPVKEPRQAGPDSPAMRARLCRQPEAVFQQGPVVNHLFDLQAR